MPILVELIASLVSAALGGTILQTVLKAVVEHEGLRRVAKSIQLRDLVAIMFIGLGVASLVTSYSGWLWVKEPRQDWWQSLHLEVGVALLLIGFVDTLLMSRLGGEKPSGSDQQRDVAA